MGSTIAPLISNLFIGCLERSVVQKLIDQGHVISWTRYADDNLAIIRKGSLDLILETINAWDKDITFTYELLQGGAAYSWKFFCQKTQLYALFQLYA